MGGNPSHSPELSPSDFHLFLHLNKFLSGQCQRQRFQNKREAEMSVTQWFQFQAADFYDTRVQKLSHAMTNVSIPEVNMLKKIANTCCIFSNKCFLKLGFVSVNSPRETYFVDAIRISQ